MWTDPVEMLESGVSTPLLNGELRSLIESESFRQMRKWGRQTHTVAEWALVVSEEFGEAMKDLCEIHFRDSLTDTNAARSAFVEEAIQTVTLLLKMIRMAEGE